MSADLLDTGFNMAAQWVGLGILWLFILMFVMSIIGWVRQLLG